MKTEGNYLHIPMQWYDKMTIEEAAVYAYLYGFVSNGCNVYRDQTEIADMFHISRNVFQRILRGLKRKGLISTKRTLSGVAYTVYDCVGIDTTECVKTNTTVVSESIQPVVSKTIQPNVSESIQPTYYIKENILKEYTKENNKAPLSHSEPLEDIQTLYTSLYAEISGNTETSEALQRLYNQPRTVLLDALRQFHAELVYKKVQQKTASDYRQHFNNWYKKRNQNHNQINHDGINSTQNRYSKLSAGFIREIAEGITSDI